MAVATDLDLDDDDARRTRHGPTPRPVVLVEGVGGDLAQAARDRHRRRHLADLRVAQVAARVRRAVAVHRVRRDVPRLAPSSSRRAVITLKRGAQGFVVAMVIGGAVGIAVARVKVLRAAIGSMITGLQTMPSVAWVPLAIILFHEGQGVIMFVVVLGAAPSIANGIIDGIDHVPPILLRAGRVLGARVQRAPPRRDPGRAPVRRRRPEAGLGVRVAQLDGGRAHRGHPRTRRDRSAPQRRGRTDRLRRRLRGDDRDLHHRRRRRRARLRHRRPRDPPPLRPHRRQFELPNDRYRSRSSISTLFILSPTLVPSATSIPSTT